MVDSTDIANATGIIGSWGFSSVYDFRTGGPRDGKTDADDLFVVQQNLNVTCAKSHAIR